MKEFKVQVSDHELAELRKRLAETRWPDDLGNDEWAYGTNAAYLRDLVEYWRSHYDWRSHEAEINSVPNFRTTIDGQIIHFVHVKGKGPNPIPLIMTHGWPWTFWDFRHVIDLLTDPVAHGGDPSDAFDVILPSLPGFAFSMPLSQTGIGVRQVASRWHQLMTEVLGYPAFAAQGGDIGALIASDLGHAYAADVIGVHLSMAWPMDDVVPDKELYSSSEQHWYEKTAQFLSEEHGYAAIQATKPQTLSYGLTDSPVGLAAWILEKRRSWSDCNGDIEARFSKDDLLTTIMIYWITRSIGTSFRSYYERRHHRWTPMHNRHPVVESPVGVASFPEDVTLLPRAWAEQYYNLKQWSLMPSGGHFAAAEEPDLLCNDIRSFFRTVR